MVKHSGLIGAGLFLAAGLLVFATPSTAAARATGMLEGRVINGMTDEPQPGVEVILTGRADDGERSFTRRAVTDGRGRYRFASLRTGDDRFYTLDALFDGGTFAGGAVTIPDDTEVTPVIDTVLRVWPTTSDPAAIVFKSDRSFVVPGGGGVAVIHSVAIANNNDRAYIGRRSGSADSDGVTLGLPLPSRAENVAIVDADIDIPELVPMTNGAGVTIAIPPGETRISYSYTVSGLVGNYELSRPALYPTREVAIFTQEPIEIESNRLEPHGTVTVSGETYTEWRADDGLDAGDPLQALAVAQAVVPIAPIAGGAALVAALVAGIVRWRRRGLNGHEAAR